ncbi:MAG: glucuronate isomerase [Clostridia bacterium]|nr:glucuronate isomerase [Clostridia bacterium]MBQ8371763.1 glucuronate isomerase [Clostridia bacterium]
MSFINDSFMLKTPTARKLYDMVKDLPIIDYHCHLSPRQIAENYKFRNAFDLFLGGDHYKWRQLRTAGIDESLITGDGDEYEKFRAFARTMPMLIGNPLYHWTHLELKRYFDIDEPLTEDNCLEVWNRCNALLATEEYRAQGLIKRSNVEVICTTDDPLDTLEYHGMLRNFETKVLPTFRPDKAVDISKADFADYVLKTGAKTYAEYVTWIRSRIEYFASYGCRLSDHAMEYVPFAEGDPEAAFDKKMRGEELTRVEIDSFKTALLAVCAEEYARRGWAMQIHIGPLRNNNKRMFESIGPDTGFDSINDLNIAEPLSAFLNHLEYRGILPKTILYNLNPKDNYTLGTMIGNFQCGPTVGKMQFGSGWWFNDQRDGMEAQMRALANLGMLSGFVGMLTDSRSFVSYPRHEYFRRIMCNIIGGWVEDGEYPCDLKALERIVTGIAYYNAKKYFNF